jgi:hypothetical protein
MSIEDVQKVNQMAQNLLDQKMVETREEAVKEAQRLLNKEIVGRKEVNEDGSAAAKDDFEYYKNIITRTKDYTLQQLNEFKRQIEALTTEVTKLKAEIAFLQSPKQTREEQLQPKQKKLKEKEEETNQRTGKFSPADVAVDKVFYYGNK